MESAHTKGSANHSADVFCKQEIIRMARDAEGDQVENGLWAMLTEDLERFAHAAYYAGVKAERERSRGKK